MRKREKRGLSGVITTIILIGIALAVVGIGYFTVMNVMEKAGEDATSRSSSLTEQIYGGWKQSPTGLVTWQNDSSNIYCEGCNVGIGTDSPVNKLTVMGSDGDDVYIRLQNADTGSTNSDGFGIRVDSNENVQLVNQENTDMYFKTASVIRMLIDNDGNVGIGTTSPGEELEVVGTIRTNDQVDIGMGASSVQNDPGIYLGNSTSANDYAHIYWDTSDSVLSLKPQNEGGGISIDPSGNVGIGTTSPDLTLDINGAARVKTFSSTALPPTCTSDTRGAIINWQPGSNPDRICWCKHTGSSVYKWTDITTGTEYSGAQCQ